MWFTGKHLFKTTFLTKQEKFETSALTKVSWMMPHIFKFICRYGKRIKIEDLCFALSSLPVICWKMISPAALMKRRYAFMCCRKLFTVQNFSKLFVFFDRFFRFFHITIILEARFNKKAERAEKCQLFIIVSLTSHCVFHNVLSW